MLIESRGQAIFRTDYWQSPQALTGHFFLSWNAGAGRLLVPASVKSEISEMRGTKCVIVSRGPWAQHSGRDAIELLFEDGSDNPYSILLVAEQTDRLLPDREQGGGFVITVWTSGGEKLRFPGKYRTVAALPCCEPWIAQ